MTDIKTLEDIYNIFGNRKLFIAREMTKMHESVYYGDLKHFLLQDEAVKNKGEFVLVVGKSGYKDE